MQDNQSNKFGFDNTKQEKTYVATYGVKSWIMCNI